jgi:hypothetical protein
MLLTAVPTTTATALFHLISYSACNCRSPSSGKLDNAESVYSHAFGVDIKRLNMFTFMYTETTQLCFCGDQLKLHKIQETSFLWAFGHYHTKSG